MYRPFARFADRYHGVRDGRAGVPARLPRPATTPHRDGLIRRARDAFERERMRVEAAQAGAVRRRAYALAGVEHAGYAVARAEQELAAASTVLTEAELSQRRSGEEQYDIRIVRNRRAEEHARRRAAASAILRAAQSDRARAVAALTVAEEEIAGWLRVLTDRVRRIHQHTHRRLARYRRQLVRSHRLGAWVDQAMGVNEPEIPGWVGQVDAWLALRPGHHGRPRWGRRKDRRRPV